MLACRAILRQNLEHRCAAGATGFKLLLETPTGLRSQYHITGWPEQNGAWPADVKVAKAERPPPTQRGYPPSSPAENVKTTPGTNALHPTTPTACSICSDRYGFSSFLFFVFVILQVVFIFWEGGPPAHWSLIIRS